MRSQSTGQGVLPARNSQGVDGAAAPDATLSEIHLQLNGQVLAVDPSLQDVHYASYRSGVESNAREQAAGTTATASTSQNEELQPGIYSRNAMNLPFPPSPSSYAYSDSSHAGGPPLVHAHAMASTSTSPPPLPTPSDADDTAFAGRGSSPDGGLSESSATPYRSLRLPPILQVEKQHVTTTATQAASASRRRNDALFKCPVPGCGSTFTRRFNLRGHLRSHTEERPFVCEWPGCGKGFARSHDCKRHTALHTAKSGSHMCSGCGKTFSRTDALNRHLKSEVGAPCRETLAQQDRNGSGQRMNPSVNGSEMPVDTDNSLRPVPFAT